MAIPLRQKNARAKAGKKTPKGEDSGVFYMKMELITWRDAGGEQDGWLDTADIDDANPIIQSVGWVVKETDNNITLAMDLSDDGDTHTRGRIPKGMVVSRIELRCSQEQLCVN